MKNVKFIFLITVFSLFFMSSCSEKHTVTLTAGNFMVIEPVSGTVTFSGPGSLAKKAEEFKLKHIEGETYTAAVVCEAAFGERYMKSRGKIFNCTDNTLEVKCSFYNGDELLYEGVVSVKPRTFSRIDQNGSIENCDRVVCEF